MRASHPLFLLLAVLVNSRAYAQEVSRSANPKPIETTVCAIMQNPSELLQQQAC
jgi:hypothetical protein